MFQCYLCLTKTELPFRFYMLEYSKKTFLKTFHFRFRDEFSYRNAYVHLSGMKVCLSHAEGSTVTTPIFFSNRAKRYSQIFYNALLVPAYSLYHFTKILRCPAYNILRRFYNVLLIPFYRDFTMPCL